jgi:hypothetical protein
MNILRYSSRLTKAQNHYRGSRKKTALMALLIFICVMSLLGPLYVMWQHVIGNVPIRLYGRVVDKNGIGIGGATVHAQVTITPFFSMPTQLFPRQMYDNSTTTTDADGRFSFRTRGSLLWIDGIQFQGMLLWNQGAHMETAIRYSKDHPTAMLSNDPSNPFVYEMVPADDPEAKWVPDRPYQPPTPR